MTYSLTRSREKGLGTHQVSMIVNSLSTKFEDGNLLTTTEKLRNPPKSGDVRIYGQIITICSTDQI